MPFPDLSDKVMFFFSSYAVLCQITLLLRYKIVQHAYVFKNENADFLLSATFSYLVSNF